MCNYSNLTNEELLRMVVMEKQGEAVVDDLTKKFKTIPQILVDADEVELLKIKGIGAKRVKQIKAVYELAKRLYSKSWNDKSYKITSPDDVSNLLMADMRFMKKEYVKIILLDTKNQVISVETISIGSLNSSIIHPREVFNIAIRKSANSIIITHNHPSGNPWPSSEDKNITNRLKEVGELVGIKLIDHIIIGDNKYISFKDKCLL